MQITKNIAAGIEYKMQKNPETGKREKVLDESGKPIVVAEWPAGTLTVEVPDVSDWTEQQLQNLAFNYAKIAIHQSPSGGYRSNGGDVSKIGKDAMMVPDSDGVLHVNPDFRIGDDPADAIVSAFDAKTLKKYEDTLARVAESKGRPLTKGEREMIALTIS